MTSKTGISILLLMLFAPALWADSLYVTDRILLGVHKSASNDSPLLQSVPSGTSLEILAEENNFKKVRLPNGTQGWVDEAFLVNEQPAPAQYDILLAKHKRTQKQLAALQQKLKKTERELQIRQDQVSNAKTSMQELKKKLQHKQPAAATVEDDQKLKLAEMEIEKLKARITELESLKQTGANIDKQKTDAAAAEKELASLRTRIKVALLSLQGKEPPTVNGMASEPPGLPGWFWGVMLLFLIAGLATGIAIMDYRHRKRHGGFRI
ncbi:MAG TPA: TIGR04211 family SH3 domain-containing protein [Gammaproteobacteria bacterium]|nr:TIGR04211 family SH3 domain-containing protein [Gammaproteobacteria bacterium]